ncbi:similar to hypothetical protein FLJ13188 (predicted), isoform CRA_d [Rattus norvegicus]|uniref:Uncharacterized protein RGD1305500_predicted n=1 Tax=Rattus norvegicus TaxID=10116 RepID=A6JI95_RAT|nr:similar to hypothetical protein FLJ13188 (predicted), isoform CRA_d [Rattus norvegicus]
MKSKWVIKSPKIGGWRELAQLLRALNVHLEILNSVPSNHTVAHNHL